MTKKAYALLTFVLIGMTMVVSNVSISDGARFFGIERREKINYTNTQSNATEFDSSNRSCLSELDVRSDADYNLDILNGATTIYGFSLLANETLVRSWDDENSPCAVAGSTLTINVSAGTFDINYTGYKF